MSIQFTLKIETENLAIVKQAFNVTEDEQLPDAILSCLMQRILTIKQRNAQRAIIGENEIELNTE